MVWGAIAGSLFGGGGGFLGGLFGGAGGGFNWGGLLGGLGNLFGGGSSVAGAAGSIFEAITTYKDFKAQAAQYGLQSLFDERGIKLATERAKLAKEKAKGLKGRIGDYKERAEELKARSGILTERSEEALALAENMREFGQQKQEEGEIKERKAKGELTSVAASGNIKAGGATTTALQDEAGKFIQNATALEVFSYTVKAQQYEYSSKDLQFQAQNMLNAAQDKLYSAQDLGWHIKDLKNTALAHQIERANLIDSMNINRDLAEEFDDFALLGGGASLLGGAPDIFNVVGGVFDFVGGLF